jgi:glycosyltransferase involved in cell wall biosynthesis
MRILLDYRPALRARTGVGEYVHQLARALRRTYPDDGLTLFTSSLRDRPAPDLGAAIPGAAVSDHRIPVSVLNLAWHRCEWPPVEWCVGSHCDVAFSPHPLLLPSRRAAQVVMIHDLDFLTHPERTVREIRRDYPQLARPHANRAHHVIVPSRYTACRVMQMLDVPADRIAICPPGTPQWSGPPAAFSASGYLLFVGTLEPRKNVGALLNAYRRLLASRPRLPKLVIAGAAGAGAEAVLRSLASPPLSPHVEYLGYVADGDRQRVYDGARLLVLPSFDEGFGMPALEAMSRGVPVIASARGALTELVGDAGLLVDPADEAAIADAIDRVLSDDGLAATLHRRGLARARHYTWDATAAVVRDACAEAVRIRAAAVSRSGATLRRVPETAQGRATTR